MLITFYCQKAMDKKPYPGQKVFNVLDGKEWVEDFVCDNSLQVFFEETVIKIETRKKEPPISEMCKFFVEIGDEYYGGGDWPSTVICDTGNKTYVFEFQVWESIDCVHVQVSDRTRTDPYFPTDYRYIDWEKDKFYLDESCEYETTINERKHWNELAKKKNII